MFKSLKIFFLLTILLIVFFESVGQPTYWKRLSWNSQTNPSYSHPEDSILHLRLFSKSINSKSYIVIDTERNKIELLKIGLDGTIIWRQYVAGYSGSIRSWVSGLNATSDGGVIYSVNAISYNTSDRWSEITKLDSLGNIEWRKSLPPVIGLYGASYQECYDIALTPTGYACLGIDTIFLLNNLGLLSGYINYRGPGEIFGFSNGDLFLDIVGFKGRVDNSGNTIYTTPYNIYFNDTNMYGIKIDSILSLNSLTGIPNKSQYWPNQGGTKIIMLADSGWASYNNRDIWRYNKDGILLWTETFPVATFGINLIGEQSDGALLTGGTYLSSRDISHYSLDYSSFIFTIDSLGQSAIDAVTQVSPGDGNNDNFFDFGDALYVALAQGSVGPSRYDSLLLNDISGYIGGDIAEDFSNSFSIGVNHKMCDYEPDGIVDSLDLLRTSFIGAIHGRGRAVPLRTRNPDDSRISSILPNFSFLPDRDSAMTGDTVRFNFILGDNGIAVDSIFGICFTLEWDTLQTWDLAYAPFSYGMNSSLGNTSDLRIENPRIIGLRNSLLLARRDLQNAYLVQDTVGYADLIILDSTSGNVDLNLSLLYFKAITAGGYPIDFQFNTKPVHLRSVISSVNEEKDFSFSLYPVPVSDQLVLDKLPAKELFIRIFNSEGMECYSSLSNKNSLLSINTKFLKAGLFLLVLNDEKGNLITRKFIKER